MKPQEHITRLIDAFSIPAQVQTGRTRQVISLLQYPEPMVFVLHQGTIGLYRSHDHLLVTHVKAPGIIGLNFLFDKNQDVYFQASGEIRYEVLPRTQLIASIRENDMWEDLAWSLMYITKRLTTFHFTSTGISTYELVRNNLTELMSESEELRLTTNACDYIHEKTMLSRSGIMKMLGDLKKGGYIELQRGVLININSLPAKY